MQLMNSVKNSVEFSSAEKAAELCNGTVEVQEQVNVGSHLCFVLISIFLVYIPRTAINLVQSLWIVAKTFDTKTER